MNRRIPVLLAAILSVTGFAVAADRTPARADVVDTTPVRVLDTRSGVGAPVGRLDPGEVLKLQIRDVTPVGETAVLLNLTGARATRRSFVSAWSCSDPKPSTSVLNVDPGRPTANAVVLPYDGDGLCFAASAPLHLIADLTGITTEGEVHVGSSHRVHDSRDGARHAGGREYRIDLAGGPGVASSAELALVNVTVTRADEAGWAIVQACGAGSNASTINFRAREAVPHFTVSALAGGDLCVTTSTDAHVIVDAFGWASASSRVEAVTPRRLLDTRDGTGGRLGPVRDGSTIRLRVAGVGGIPNDAAGAILNVAAFRASALGFVSLHACGEDPGTSTINMWPGVRRANQAILMLPPSGELCVTTTIDDASSVHLIVDSVGYVDGDVSRPEPPPTTTPTTAPPTTVPFPTLPPTSEKFTTLPVGAALPSGAECAQRVRPAAEIRPENAAANANRGSRANANTRSDWSGFDRVDGAFAGTTDEIIQWAACKWGIDEDMVRAQVVKESWWYQSANGDGGESWGLGQVRDTAHQSAFQYPSVNARNSSAYNLDYTYASWRACYEGAYTWLNTVERGAEYGPGDAWGCFGVWFSGRWYTDWALVYLEGGDTNGYGSRGVKTHHELRTWEDPVFVNG